MERALFSRLEEELARDPERYGPAEPEDYYRRYAGFIEDGQRHICIVGSHRQVYERQYAATTDWRAPILIRDGGSIQFRVRYNPVDETFVQFAFNFHG